MPTIHGLRNSPSPVKEFKHFRILTLAGITMKLAEWARKNGVHCVSARRWFRAGILPIPARQHSPGTIFVDDVLITAGSAVRVMNESELKGDLTRDMVDILISLCARLYCRVAAMDPVNAARMVLP
jgi:predicted site-specific integrase-resolvase